MRARFCTGSFFDVFPLSQYFVLSALDSVSHDSIYRNILELSLFIFYVNKHDFESPWP